jgi:NADH dehydrogenase/putative oxidoreductase
MPSFISFAVRFTGRLTAGLQAVAWPWVDVAIRCWLAQAFWMSGLAGFVGWADAVRHAAGLAPGWLMRPEALAMVVGSAQLACAPLLVLGFATRLCTLPMLAAGLLAMATSSGQDGPLLWTLLAAWYVAIGPGPLSLDGLIARGIYDSALPLAAPLGRALAALSRFAKPALQVLLRAGLAWVLVRHGTMHTGWALAVPVLLTVGLATRLAALPLLAATGAATMMHPSADHVQWTLLLLLVLAQGPGPLSLDGLIGASLRRMRAMSGALPADAPHVVIVGGGFAGIEAARGLRGAACRITLIDQNNHHLFQPLLYQVATASLSPADIATPIRSLFRGQDNLAVRLGRVEAIDTAAQEIALADGARVRFDFLLLATGARHGYFGRDAWEAHAPGLKTLDDATAIRRRLLLAFERAESETDPQVRDALLTFAVIGGGPTGVELAGAIAELARHGLAGEFRSIDPAMARVLLIQAGDRLLPTFPPALSRQAADALAALGVEVQCGPGVDAVEPDHVSVGGLKIPCRTAFWAAGVAASPAAAWLGAPADRAGRVIVGPDLSVAGHSGIFVAGDTALVNGWNGGPVPGLAPAAKQAGAYAAKVIRARIDGAAAPAPFSYRHAGNLATIGRRAAVADFGRLRLAGATAWWLWGAVHVLFLASTRNRIVVGVQWFWAYLTYGRGIRLITGTEE